MSHSNMPACQNIANSWKTVRTVTFSPVYVIIDPLDVSNIKYWPTGCSFDLPKNKTVVDSSFLFECDPKVKTEWWRLLVLLVCLDRGSCSPDIQWQAEASQPEGSGLQGNGYRHSIWPGEISGEGSQGAGAEVRAPPTSECYCHIVLLFLGEEQQCYYVHLELAACYPHTKVTNPPFTDVCSHLLSSALLQLPSSAGCPKPAGRSGQSEAAEHPHAVKEML